MLSVDTNNSFDSRESSSVKKEQLAKKFSGKHMLIRNESRSNTERSKEPESSLVLLESSSLAAKNDAAKASNAAKEPH